VVTVFGDEAGMAAAAEMDETLGRLPGLQGIRIVREALAGAMRRTGMATRPGRERLATPFAALRA
jgi:hypothetical protein